MFRHLTSSLCATCALPHHTNLKEVTHVERSRIERTIPIWKVHLESTLR